MSTPNPAPGKDAVIAHDIVLRRGSRTAIDASSFTIPSGQITAIIGPNGSGKSTLLHAIAGLLPVSDGELTESIVDAAAPIFDSSGNAIGAIAVGARRERISNRYDALGALVLAAARDVSTEFAE